MFTRAGSNAGVQDIAASSQREHAGTDYLTTPFLYIYPGFTTEELEPWHENEQEWRRLRVTFPDSVASQTREQIPYFGPDGHLRRNDYTVHILGGATGANYASECRTVGGIVIPTKRAIYAYEGDHQMVSDPALVAITIGDTMLT